MGRYTRFFIACSIGFIVLTFVNPTVCDDATLEINGKAHSEYAATHRNFHQHHKHHHHHHQHYHQHHNHDIDGEKTKKNHHRRNRKMSLNPPMRGDDREALHLGDLQSSFVSFQAFLDRNSARPARNRREKDVKSPPIKSLIVSTSTTLNTNTTTNATTTTTSTPATVTAVTESLLYSLITTESGSKPSISCSNTNECTNITNSICTDQKSCGCTKELPVYIASMPECTNSAVLNATCRFDDQCLYAEEYSNCDKLTKRCVCIAGYEMKEYPDVGVNCVTKTGKSGGLTVDPAMIGVLAGLGLMFIIICVVLRLFSKARFRENRSIFNTPNPRLMNASLFKDSKLLSPARGERRGSRASMRGPPSRAPSITSVNKDGAGRSPNGSLSKGRRGSTLSTASATGSAAAAAPPSAKTPSPTSEKKQQQPAETTVAIEAVD